MKLIKMEKVGDVTASLYLEKHAYTYKIKARIDGRVQIVARSYVWLADKKNALEKMEADLFNVTHQLSLFNERKN